MIAVSRDGGLLVVTLNRPDKANALTKGMLGDLLAAVAGPAPQALILTGVGKVFSAGADLEEMAAGLGVDPLWEQVSGA
ncbi:MAG: enoyl-CoA hydratase/isomerase family protein, partial [Cypionkella sp.]